MSAQRLPLRCAFGFHVGAWTQFLVAIIRRNHPDGLESRRYTTREYRVCDRCRTYEERKVADGVLPHLEPERRRARQPKRETAVDHHLDIRRKA